MTTTDVTTETSSVTAPAQQQGLVIFAVSGDLDKIWPTLILASTGAASGMPTTVFFSFWSLFALVREDVRRTGDNWMQKMVSMMNRGGTRHLKLSKMNFAGAGPRMMRKLAKQHKAPLPGDLLELARELDVRLVPCQMTMDLLGLHKEDLIDGVEEPAGAATALQATQGATTLFI
jgi:peroxiredoxin family protein